MPNYGASGASASKQPGSPPDEVGYTISEALRTPAFWALSLCSVEGSAVHTAVMFHAFSIVEVAGTLTATTAAAMIAARSVVGAPVNVIAGGTIAATSIRPFPSSPTPLLFGPLSRPSTSAVSTNVAVYFTPLDGSDAGEKNESKNEPRKGPLHGERERGGGGGGGKRPVNVI